MGKLMVTENPFAAFRSECEKALRNALHDAFPEVRVVSLSMEKPPSPDFGQLASSLSFDLSKQVHDKPLALAEKIIKAFDKSKFDLISNVAAAGAGYVNFHVGFSKLSALTLESATVLDAEYGFVRAEKPVKVIVEHTSVNPTHPMHIGTARNPALGDTLARLLKARGHTVYRHYYVDDVGRQSSVIAYGYEKLGRPKPEGKPDAFVGKIYTVTSCMVEINRLKKQLALAKVVSSEEEISKTTKELDEWVAVAAELKSKYPDLFEMLLERISKDEDPEEKIEALNRAYEAGDKKAKQLIREVSQLCLDGFIETLKRIDVTYDSWDWESDLVWSGEVEKVLRKLKKSKYTYREGAVWEFNAGKVVQDLGLRTELGLKDGQELPPLTLVRADGTTLYTTRDVAYTLWKFNKADKVINVIGNEQTLAQLQLKIALHILGHAKYANNLVHFAYNLVSLPGYKMSGRRGRYVSFDEVMDEAVNRAHEEVSKRSPQLSEEEKRKIADFVGIGAVRYALVEVDTAKPVVFTWDRVLNFEKNSAPYIQYTHARACSILRKAAKKPEKPAYELLTDKLEQAIVLLLSSFPDTFVDASECYRPNMIADFANALSDKFNTFYNALPVIKAEPQGLSDARLSLTMAVRTVLRNALNMIGIFAPERM